MTKLAIAFVIMVAILTVGGFAVLAAWDVSVKQEPVEKMLDNHKFLTGTN